MSYSLWTQVLSIRLWNCGWYFFKTYRYAEVDFSDETNSNGDGKEVAQDGNDDYSDTVQHVGQSEFIPPPPPPRINTATNGGNDNSGVHIQASCGTKDGEQAKKKPVYLTLLQKYAIQFLIL